MVTETREHLADAVAAYSRRLHTEIGTGHHVASPLGAWLLLALAGAAARDAEAERLADVLGMPAADAARHARALLDAPHPAVAAAAAAWVDGQGTPSDRARQWLAELPASVEQGPVPSQDVADAWARERTLGLIERFPLHLDGFWSMVLASALATRVRWSRPFDTTDARVLRSPWSERLTSVLRTPERGHDGLIGRHPEAGDVAVHRAHADGLDVTSVIAAPDVPAAAVLAAAHDAARDRIERYALRDLPIGDGHAWTVMTTTGGRPERFTAVLPAWSATSEHDLSAPALGFADAATVLGGLFGGDCWDARQTAVARYHRTGFEAAAVTAVAVRASLSLGEGRAALMRFDRPYAVVATATGPGPWSDLPVFSAWVTEPEDAGTGAETDADD